jgi:hypothetical protein
MRTLPILSAAALLCVTAPCFAHPRHGAAASANIRHAALHAHHVASHATVRHEVMAMDPDRATAIQQALIRNGYLTGEPTGVWDAQTTAAMQKLQGDNGWQTKITPDSRALIKLGLGPQSNIASNDSSPQ